MRASAGQFSFPLYIVLPIVCLLQNSLHLDGASIFDALHRYSEVLPTTSDVSTAPDPMMTLLCQTSVELRSAKHF